MSKRPLFGISACCVRFRISDMQLCDNTEPYLVASSFLCYTNL